MQTTQQPVQAKPTVVQKPVATAQTLQKPVKKKPKNWWIKLLVAILVIGGGIWAYFQFLA